MWRWGLLRGGVFSLMEERTSLQNELKKRMPFSARGTREGWGVRGGRKDDWTKVSDRLKTRRSC